MISQLNDRDSFTFTAHQTGRVTVSAGLTHELIANWKVDAENFVVIGEQLQFDVSKGREYTVSLGTDRGLDTMTLIFLLRSQSLIGARSLRTNFRVTGSQRITSGTNSLPVNLVSSLSKHYFLTV